MQNMLVPPTEKELAECFSDPFVIYNAGVFPCNRQTDGMTSSTSIAVSFKRREMVILGTQYAGEMKKGVFTVMNYLMPCLRATFLQLKGHFHFTHRQTLVQT